MSLERKPSGAYDAAYPLPVPAGGTGYASARILVDVSGNPLQVGSKQETLTLINNNVASQPQTAFGGDYIWSVVGTFGGASVQLQALGPDGASYQNIGAAKTSADTTGGTGVGLGTNAVVRAAITGGTPTGLFAALSRIP